ncbi:MULTISPECIES: ProQ/FinO family protein [Legionella]|uniref:Activator of prop osmoprotectant transporter n=1 Tax=Legionella septentrionalis TaxID=2498109 RepID=A0A3S0V4M7_9GAMM|nr:MULTISPECIES: ProQ/FinO family protein [Legionella]MCP0914718.1 ProQ/FinO family protein [Legionella sp. 27cVA30]RUQ81726.1 activator of prop osmoprotectant transporter [Legionella septentrionalis]RUR02791.1 activator of prop osmoprotectant transporter [Legionella septentrionalis]RUR11389.1 activator of prop osmoprotectant transporter [Legionella septentrionalis]RUR15136.1 activator of prop osmoprotectant transporter [Legionella septentrionalis]
MRKQELHPRTAVVNKKQKNESKKARYDALRWLAVNFPKAFDNSVSIQPLKAGIMDDILAYADKAEADGISRSKLREAVVVYTRRVDYLATLKAREMRIDLQGNPVVAVSEEEAERAASKLKKRVEKSAKNTRRNLLPAKTLGQGEVKTMNPQAYSFGQDGMSAERSLSAAWQGGTPPAKSAPVMIRHKQSRQYDPDAVARLKEKLGLPAKREISD